MSYIPQSDEARAEQDRRWQDWSSRPGAIEEVCAWVASGKVLLQWTRLHDFCFYTVSLWLKDDPFRADLYAVAEERNAECMACEIFRLEQGVADLRLDMAETGRTAAKRDRMSLLRLRLDALKFCYRANGRRLPRPALKKPAKFGLATKLTKSAEIAQLLALLKKAKTQAAAKLKPAPPPVLSRHGRRSRSRRPLVNDDCPSWLHKWHYGIRQP